MKKIIKITISLLIITGTILLVLFGWNYYHENKILNKIINRLEADSRIAKVMVTAISSNKENSKNLTTIKFLEYNTKGQPLKPKYFTFSGNIIQFQSLVIRFDDIYIRKKDKFRGKSAYLFWKAFMLDGENTEEYTITRLNKVPKGYEVIKGKSGFEEKLWKKFWTYAFDNKKANNMGIKNAQIEAPGTKFIPGMIYTIKIEHDGGMRIDSEPVPEILRGEKILSE